MRLRHITLVGLLLGLFAPVTQAATRTWAVAAGDWFVAGNWGGTVPGVGDDVVVTNVGASVFLTNATPYLASFTLGGTNAGARTLTFSNWNTTLSAANVALLTNGTMTCAGPFANAPIMSNRISIACGNMFIQEGGTINANGKGYARAAIGNGPGGGGDRAGGGHGGSGGNYAWVNGSPYDSYVAPLYAGSGGGGAAAGDGGGVVRIQADGNVTVNGRILVDGAAAGANDGGGAGGSVFITCTTFTGTNGVITAIGGTLAGNGGGGGGGRVSIVYDPVAQGAMTVPIVRISLLGGWSPASGYPGELGTLFFPDTQLLKTNINYLWGEIRGIQSWSPPSLTISNSWIRFSEEGFRLTVSNNLILQGSSTNRLELGGLQLLTNASVGLYGTYVRYSGTTSTPTLTVGGNLILSNNSSLIVYGGLTNATTTNYGALLSVTGDIVVASNCWIYPVSNPTNGGSPLFRANNVFISGNAGFYAYERGYIGGNFDNGSGPGKGGSRSGGGYGGVGGYQFPGITNGMAVTPMDPGSGGGRGTGAGAGYVGGNGGGLVRIQARQTLSLDGSLTANGGNLGQLNQGAGAGGGIYVQCRNFTGAAGIRLSAVGGSKGAAGVGGGGGGRIAVWRTTDSYLGGTVVTGGWGSTFASTTTPGTVVWVSMPDVGVSTAALACTVTKGDSTNLSFQVWNSATNGTTLAYVLFTNADWLSLSPASGTSTGEQDTITVTCNSALAGSSVVTGQITAAMVQDYSDYQFYQNIQVVMNVRPVLAVSPTNFFRSITMGTNAASQSFQVWNSGSTNALYYEIVSDASWLSVSPTNGTSSGEYDPIAINYATAGLAVGTYTGHLAVTALDVASGLPAANSPVG
ncbi:MAG: hypothetical protein HY343_07880, partial [Lentisphaerae bacterium]|nr:hypothetical protein [Lentisphaerota bacterium]